MIAKLLLGDNSVVKMSIISLRWVGVRPVSIMLQNLPIMLFSISQIFCLLCSFLWLPNMNYADNFCRLC